MIMISDWPRAAASVSELSRDTLGIRPKSTPRVNPTRCSNRQSLQSQVFPFLVYQRFGLFVHQDFVGPGAGEAFAGPFAGGVDSHLRSVVGQAGGVIERIDGAKHELNVALG